MTTNKEIIGRQENEQDYFNYGRYNPDSVRRMIEEIQYITKEITELLKFPNHQITMTTLTLHEILDDNTKNTFKKIENQLLEITGCSNPYCQNYPDKEEEWEKLKKE